MLRVYQYLPLLSGNMYRPVLLLYEIM